MINMPAKIYTEKDASLHDLAGERCALLGFGSQGEAQALNLKESGVEVLIGLYPESKSWKKAEQLGFQVVTTGEAVAQASVIGLALPDLKIPAIFEAEIKPHLTSGKTLLFLHGFALHYKTIAIASDINVILLSPKGGPGPSVRQQFLKGKGIFTAMALFQDPSKKAKRIALAWAKGIGSTRAGVIESSFQEETETNLFGEQAVLCGGVNALIQSGFETLVEAGYQEEMAYLSTLHELKLTVDLIHERGISGMLEAISETAQYGALTVGPKIMDAFMKQKMKEALGDVQSGKFAQTLMRAEKSNERLQFLETAERHPIENVGKRLRKLVEGKS
ncbi:MAG: ketol-acid reductoisomerase [Chthoniobacterales bacterium]|nr:ketol-acid reductoisomerase [Chthoniobacterales bacterium]